MSAHRLRTSVCDLLGSDYPILQAGMGGPIRGHVGQHRRQIITVAGGGAQRELRSQRHRQL